MDKHFADFQYSPTFIGIAGVVLSCAAALQLAGQAQSLTQSSDALLIVVFLSTILLPVLYFCLPRPLMQHTAERKRTEAALYHTRHELDMRVTERPTALEDVNNHLQGEVRKLQESEACYRGMFDTARDAIFLISPKGTVEALNPAFETMTGYALSEWLGRPFELLLPSEDVPLLQQFFKFALQGETLPAIRIRLQAKSGQIIHAEANITPHIITGTIVGVLGIARDLTERLQAEEALDQANERLRMLVTELKDHNRETTLLAEFGELLQGCTTTEEAYRVIGHIGPQLFPHTSGVMFTLKPSRDDFEAVVKWGEVETELGQRLVEPSKCWALRRGRLNQVGSLCEGLPCRTALENALCVPMIAQGETLGMLHLQGPSPSETGGQNSGVNEKLAIISAERIAMALANLALRETLYNQSVRDPLTGLFNRRFMEETLSRELRRAERNQQPLGIIILDLDHFKRFNDTFGHDAGDTLLREVGSFLKANIRGSDVACRFGGEEFLLILPDSTVEGTRGKAEQLRRKISMLTVEHLGQSLGTVTASLGIAVFPNHALTTTTLLRTADQALYKAKRAGRNRVVEAESDRGMNFPEPAERITGQHSIESGLHAVNVLLSSSAREF